MRDIIVFHVNRKCYISVNSLCKMLALSIIMDGYTGLGTSDNIIQSFSSFKTILYKLCYTLKIIIFTLACVYNLLTLVNDIYLVHKQSITIYLHLLSYKLMVGTISQRIFLNLDLSFPASINYYYSSLVNILPH